MFAALGDLRRWRRIEEMVGVTGEKQTALRRHLA